MARQPRAAATTAVSNANRGKIDDRALIARQRTLLTSGMTLAGVESFHRGEQTVETPEMAVRYQAPKESLFWND